MGRKARRKKVKDENREDWIRKKGTGPEKKGGRLRAVSGAFVEVGKEKNPRTPKRSGAKRILAHR